MELGSRLKYLRDSKNISIYRLSQLTGISQGHISDLENGKNQPTIETLKKITTVLGISLSDFFNETGEVAVLTDIEKELITTFRTIPNDKTKLYLELGKALQNNI